MPHKRLLRHAPDLFQQIVELDFEISGVISAISFEDDIPPIAAEILDRSREMLFILGLLFAVMQHGGPFMET